MSTTEEKLKLGEKILNFRIPFNEISCFLVKQ